MTDPRELLDELERELASNDDRTVDEFRDRHPKRVAAIDALRDVLKLHQAETVLVSGRQLCSCCLDVYGDQQHYPCDTVETITRALGGAEPAPHPDWRQYIAGGEIYAGDEG